MTQEIKTIHIVSGGSGAAASQMVNTVLVQFPESRVIVKKTIFVRNKPVIENLIDEASKNGDLVVHTLLDSDLRSFLVELCQARKTEHLDLIEGTLSCFSNWLGVVPNPQPGLYHRLNQDYFNRIDAIEFSMAHDDNRNLPTLKDAEIVLLGVSRVGKTPLSMYLAVHGWKTANIALVKSISLPQELEQVDRRRIIGLFVDLDQLIAYRTKRIRETGLGMQTSSYSDRKRVFEESEYFRALFKQRKYATIDVSNKPIETSFNEVLHIITSRLGDQAHSEQENSRT